MRPGWLDLVFSLHSGLGELQILFLEIGKWSENVFLDHGHHVVQMGDNQTHNRFLILQQLLDLVNGVESFGLALDILALVLVIVVLLANKQLLLEGLLGVLGCGTPRSSLVMACPLPAVAF